MRQTEIAKMLRSYYHGDNIRRQALSPVNKFHYMLVRVSLVSLSSLSQLISMQVIYMKHNIGNCQTVETTVGRSELFIIVFRMFSTSNASCQIVMFYQV